MLEPVSNGLGASTTSAQEARRGVPEVLRASPWVAVLLAAGTFLLYAQLAGHQFLHYDDNVYVTENPVVLRGLTWSGVVWAFTSPDAWYGFPLAWLSHMLDVQVFGVRPGAHLLVNALLHAVNAVLVYRVLARMTGKAARSAAVSALFAVHPLRVEVVAWVSERKELLSTLFALAALWAYAAYSERPAARRYALVVLLFAASLLAKPMWVGMPFLLLLLDRWPLERKAPLGRLALEKLPLLVLAVASSWVAYLAQQHGGALRGADLPIGSRLAYAAVSWVLYVGKTFWPASLSPYYPHPGASLSPWLALGAALAVAAATGLSFTQARRRPWIPVGWLWFVGMLVPVIGIVRAGRHGIADRYTYAPGIGLLVLVVWTAAELAARFRVERFVRVLLGIVVVALAAVSWRQQTFWSDQVTLFSRAVEITPDSGLAHHILSQGLVAEGRYAPALLHAREAARLEPDVARVRKNLGYVFYRLGLLDEAVDELRAAIALEPGYAEAHGNLAIVYGKKGAFEAAAKEFSLERELRGRAPPP